VTVTERTREIGLGCRWSFAARCAAAFLLEAVLLSVGGGVLGIVAGLALPVAAETCPAGPGADSDFGAVDGVGIPGQLWGRIGVRDPGGQGARRG